METIKQLIAYLIMLCDLGGAVRIIYCLIQISANPDEVKSFTKKIIHLLFFLVLANTALALKAMIEGYF